MRSCFHHALAVFFFFNDTATTEIYTLSLHDALPIYRLYPRGTAGRGQQGGLEQGGRSEEHTSELQSRRDLVCRLLLEKKKHSGARVVSSERPRFHRLPDPL